MLVQAIGGTNSVGTQHRQYCPRTPFHTQTRQHNKLEISMSIVSCRQQVPRSIASPPPASSATHPVRAGRHYRWNSCTDAQLLELRMRYCQACRPVPSPEDNEFVIGGKYTKGQRRRVRAAAVLGEATPAPFTLRPPFRHLWPALPRICHHSIL